MEERMYNNEKSNYFEADKIPTANIIIAGITGTGKSTLTNAVFGEKIAETGTGRAITSNMVEYSRSGVPIKIWDTVGLELDYNKTKKSIDQIKNTIAKKATTKNAIDCVHAIWYCINSSSRRYQGEELEFIKSLYSLGVPFIIVLTQCISSEREINEFENIIRQMNRSMGISNVNIVQVLAEDYKLRDNMCIPAFGLEELVELTVKSMPSFIRSGFIAAQKVDKKQKREECEKIIYDYVLKAKMGFWERVPLVNLFAVDDKMKKMITQIGIVYNVQIPDDKIKSIIRNTNMDMEDVLLGLLSPIDFGYNKKMMDLLFSKKEKGFKIEMEEYVKSDRVAVIIAFYGYVFISSIEDVWEKINRGKIKDLDEAIQELIRNIREIMGKRRSIDRKLPYR